MNTTSSGVRITHIATGLSAEGTLTRSQAQNKVIAFHKLADKILKWHVTQEEKIKVRSTEVIRTYNSPDNRVKDHLSGFTQNYTDVMNDISLMVDARYSFCEVNNGVALPD